MMRRELILVVLVALLVLGVQSVMQPPVAVEARSPNGFRALSGRDAANFVVPDDMEMVRSFELTAYGLTYERYQQYFGRARAQVLGGQITVYKDDSGAITMVIGAHYPDIAPKNTKRRGKDDARRTVDRDIGPAGQRKVDLMIDPRTGNYFHRVETRRFDSRWFHWIDADNGRVLNKYDGITTDDGIGVKGDTKSLLGPDGNPGTPDDLTTQQGGSWKLLSKDGRQQTYDAENKTSLPGSIATDGDNHWNLPGNASDGQPALVDAHFYADVADSYYTDQHGFDWIGGCPYSAMKSVAHYKIDYNNAFWNGTYVVYGDGSGTVFRELSGGLDVVVHEYTHGVTDCTSDLIYSYESGALSESFSDMLGNSAEFYARDPNGDGNFSDDLDPSVTPEWWIGEDIYVPEANGFRNMADPAEDNDPDHYSELLTGPGDNGGVHSNSGIPNHAYYLLVNGGSNAGEARGHAHSGPVVTGIGLTDAEQIFFTGFIGLPASASMAQARAATETAAIALFGEGSQQSLSTIDAWAAVGVGEAGNCNDPDAAIPFQSAHPYANQIDCTWTYDNGTADFSLHFSLGELENNYDYLYIMDGNNNVLETLTGVFSGHTTVNIPTSVAKVRLVTDQLVTADGFIVDAIEEADSTPPDAVINLDVSAYGMSTVTLAWTATGDDGMIGTASSYDVRYDTSPIISDTDWAGAAQATSEPNPQAPGSQETFTISGLDPSTMYYAALKVIDNAGNTSGLSNSPSGSTEAGTTVFSDNMEGGTNGWTVAGTPTPGLWHQSNHNSSSPSTAWYYGIEGAWNYVTGATNSGTLTSPQIDLTGATEATLSFSYWLQRESGYLGIYDRAEVQASSNGTSYVTLPPLVGFDTDDTWPEVTFDLGSYVGGMVYIRFSFDTVDGAQNNYEGWYIDDVKVIADLPGSPSTGTVMGTVVRSDDDTVPIPDASVVVVGTSKSATTDASGSYSIFNVPNGTYDVEASATGFESMTVLGVEVASTTVVHFPLNATAAPTVPGTPANVSATAGNAEVTVTWQAPASDGGSAITSYTVTSDPGPFTATTADGSTLTATVTGLTNGTPYTFTVTATNAVGTGPASTPSNAVTPEAPPVAAFSGTPTSGDAPLTVVFTDASTGSMDTWSWDFGDTGTSSVQNPSYIYTAAGTYTVSLTVTGPGGADTQTITSYITVSTPPAPPATDVVTITKATYNWKKGELSVDATSSMGGNSVTLTAKVFAPDKAIVMSYSAKKGKYTVKISGLTSKPSEVEVTSSEGGSDIFTAIGGKG